MLELSHLLSDPVLIQTFADFLLKENASEPLEFWIRAEMYRHLEDAKKLMKAACKIYKKHLKPEAAAEVNLDARMKVLVGMKLKSKQISPQLFSSLQKDAHTMLSFDFLPRFCKAYSGLAELLSKFHTPTSNFKFGSSFGRVLKKYCATLKVSSSSRRSIQMLVGKGGEGDAKRASISVRNSINRASSSMSLSVKRQSKEMLKRKDVSAIATRFSRALSIVS